MDKPKLFRENIYLALLQMRSPEQLSEYDGMVLSEHLQKAVEAYLKNQKFDFSAPAENDITIKFMESVTELVLPEANNNFLASCIVNYDRGWISGLVKVPSPILIKQKVGSKIMPGSLLNTKMLESN